MAGDLVPTEASNAFDAVTLALACESHARQALDVQRQISKDLHIENLQLRQRLGETDLHFPVTGSNFDFKKHAQRALDGPASHMDWQDFEYIESAFGEEARLSRWSDVVEDQRLALESGEAGAEIVMPNATPAENARYIVIRQGLIDEWQARPGSEMLLIDMLAQTRFLYELWLRRHVFEATHDCTGLTASERERRKYGEWFPPRVSEADEVALSASMVTKFQNQFMKLLRSLRDLRRMSTSLVIHQAGQVNVGQQQVNLGLGDARKRETIEQAGGD